MNEPQKKPHYGWLIILGCMIMVFCCVGLALNVFSIFVTPLAEELELTKTQVSTVMSMISVGSILVLMFSGRIYQRYSTRKAMFIFGLCVAGGFLLFAWCRTLPQCYAAALLVGIGSGGGGLVPATLLITRWFSTKRGLAISLSAMGSGIGSMIFPPIVAYWIEGFGLAKAFIFYGLLIAALVSVTFLLIRNEPGEKGLQPYGCSACPDLQAAGEVKGLTFAETLRTIRYWGLVVTALAAGMMISPINNHLPSFLLSLGYDPMFTAMVFSLFGGTLIIGKLLTGAIIDRFGITVTNWFLFSVWGLALASAFLVDGSPAKACLLTILIGLGNPILTIPIPIWVAELFGLRDYAKVFSTLTLMISLGGAIGYSLVGFMADVTGTYLTAYGVFTVVNLLLILLLQLIFREKQVSLT